jgi:DNA-cytosine methyltransferase
MNEKTHLDLFSGIGGFALAAKWNGYRTVAFCDNEPYAQAVLKKHWPDVPCHQDIREVRGELYAGVTLLTGGFPCQPFSCAGKQRGKDDNRYLWPEMLRVIREAKPTWIVGENVAGIVNLALDQVCTDLEAEGYEVEPIIIPACGVDAPHKRDRVWIVAHTKGGERGGYNTRSARKGHKIAISYLESRVDYLENYAPKMWPTPTAGLEKHSTEKAYWENRMNKGRQMDIQMAVYLKEQSGSLNPAWVEWLMGYPTEHTVLRDWATPSSRKSRQKSSDASTK